QSVRGTGPDQKTDFAKNIDTVSRLLAQVPPSARVVVLGITDKSFTQPYILLSERVTDDPGYFGERLAAAREELVRRWQRRSQSLAPQFKYTDILGALAMVEQIFAESPEHGRRILVILSDMRHHTADLDLESGKLVPSFSKLKMRKGISCATLRDAEVY